MYQIFRICSKNKVVNLVELEIAKQKVIITQYSRVFRRRGKNRHIEY
jgi:hypothetical protein